LKQIRNTESSVQPSRDNKAKISDEIQKLKYKEPTSPKLVTLEQELVRAEAQNLVAEAQLTNIVSRCGLLINAFMLTIGQDTSKVEGSVRPPFQIPFHAPLTASSNYCTATTYTSQRRSSAPKSKSSSPNMAVACSTTSTTPPSSPVTCTGPSTTPTMPGKC